MVCISNQNQENQSKPGEYKVFIGTPYLTDSAKDFECSEDFLKQVFYYGLDPNNLNGVKFLHTPKKNIVRLSTGENSRDITFREIARHDLAIAGSTEPVEEKVHGLRGSGLIVARYSIFYGKPSGYTERTPEQGGYSLDLPKVVGCAVALMTDDNFLEALVSREEARIRDAIENLNRGKESAPILITPYLAEALNVQKNQGGRQ